jgi:hypothetical protein
MFYHTSRETRGHLFWVCDGLEVAHAHRMASRRFVVGDRVADIVLCLLPQIHLSPHKWLARGRRDTRSQLTDVQQLLPSNKIQY